MRAEKYFQIVEKLNLWDEEEKQFEVVEKFWDVEIEDNIFYKIITQNDKWMRNWRVVGLFDFIKVTIGINVIEKR